MSNEKNELNMEDQINDDRMLDPLEGNADSPVVEETYSKGTRRSLAKNRIAWIATAVIVGVVLFAGAVWILTRSTGGTTVESANTGSSETTEEPGHSESEEGREVRLEQESQESIGISTEEVTQRPAISKLYVTGSVELNPERTEMATPLVGGRIENVYFGVGDYVNQGVVLATVSSPQLAEIHGKLNEARNRVDLAQKNLERVQRAENRVSILDAKAKLDEAEATLRRTRRLIELGAGAGKDLVTAETNFRTAKADYEFQSNIALNKELQEAKAELQTAQVDFQHTRNQLKTLGLSEASLNSDDHSRTTSLVAVRAPISGVITERKFNAGAGIDAVTPLFAISNLSTVFVIANVPEANLGKLRIGSIAEIKSASLGTINGNISYIDPRLDEVTRTGRVRVEVPNQGGKLRAGMFTEVGFYAGTNETTGQELVINSEAIQREGDKTIVFIPKDDEPGSFEVREIEIGGQVDGYTAVRNGLKLGDKVVTKGSFALRTQLQKGDLGGHGH